MMTPAEIRHDVQQVVDEHVIEAIELFEVKYGFKPEVKHACLKFTDINSYKLCCAAVKDMGKTLSEEFNGKEIFWCKLHKPIEYKDISIAFLEMVEPKIEKNSYNGITSLGFFAPNLKEYEVVKINASDESMIYRYMGRAVQPDV